MSSKVLVITAVSALQVAARLTVCTTNATWFCRDGVPLHPGTAVQGILFNSRMIQGIWDDANSSTVNKWQYPDGSPYSASRQTAELIGNLSSWSGCGLDAFTVGLQGGGPQVATPPDQPWISSGFDQYGNPLQPWFDRLSAVIEAARDEPITPIVNLFYQGQIERLQDDDAVINAVNSTVQWLVSRGYVQDVAMDVANEVGYFNSRYTTLQPGTIADLIGMAKQSSWGQLLVSSSFGGGVVPPDSAIAASDFVLIHCNSLTPHEATQQVAAVRASSAWQGQPKPIVYNECGTNYTVFDAAIASGAGWGNYDQGSSNYRDGFQSPPTNWDITSSSKKVTFFSKVAAYTGSNSTCCR